MKKIPVRLPPLVLALTLVGSLLAAAPTASADPPYAGLSAEVRQIINAELRANPGGEVRGNEIHYDDGTVFVAIEEGVFSLGECGGGRFCGWQRENYAGSFRYTSGAGTTRTLSWNTKSYYNNRVAWARLYNSSGTGSLCFGSRQQRASVPSGYHSPSKVYLSATSSC